MALNWLEEVVSHLYKLRGYIVLENVDLPMPEGESGRAEFDIIAIRGRELVHVECMAGWWPGKDEGEKREFQRLRNKFERAPKAIFERYSFLERSDYEIINVFVTSGSQNPQPNGPWSRLQEFCEKEGIKLIEINRIVEDLIRELRKEYPGPERVGEKGIARFLIHLIHNDFLKRPQE